MKVLSYDERELFAFGANSQVGELGFAVGVLKRVDKLGDVSVDDLRQTVERKPDAVVREPVLRKIVSANALGAVAASDLVFALCGVFGAFFFLLFFVNARKKNFHRFSTVAKLGAFVRTINHDSGRFVDNLHGGFGFVDVLPAGAGRARNRKFDIFRNTEVPHLSSGP